MNLNAKYDVFVSYSRKDYVDESKKPVAGSSVAALLDFLDKNGITYWFDKDGIYSGSEFVEVITDAITDSKMMIFVSSEHSNASPWTTGEIFEALEQEKLIVPFKIDNSPYNKKYRMMVRPLDFIEYFTNPDVAFDSLLKAINICKEEYAQAVAEEEKRKAEENAKQRKAEILEEIKTESLDFQRHAFTLAQDAKRLVEKQKLVGNKEKKCPVCSTMQPIEDTFCKKCGWTFNPIFDAHPRGDKDHLFVMRSLWNAVHDTDTIRINLENKMQELESLRKEKDALTATVQRLQQQLEVAKTDAQQLSEQSKAAENQWRNKISEISQQLTAANTSLAEKERRIASLEKRLSDAQATLSNVDKKLEEYKNAEVKARREAEDEKAKRECVEKVLVDEKKKLSNKDNQIKKEQERNIQLEKKHKEEEETLWNELDKITAELTNYKNIEAKLNVEIEHYKQNSLKGKAEEDSVWDELEKVSSELQTYKEKETKLRVEIDELIKDINDKQESKAGVYGDKYFVINGIRFKMIAVHAGRNIMYDKGYSWGVVHKRCIAVSQTYMCGETQVTQSLWNAVMGNNPSCFKGENRPVEQISWNDCQLFIANLNKKTGLQFRLLTEAEWEFAARGGVWCKDYDYSGGYIVKDYAWFKDNSLNETHEVKTRKPNALGIYDMSGNVQEWCEDWYGDWETYFDYIDYTGPKNGNHKVCRGGAYNSKDTHCRIEHRENWSPNIRKNFIGFRLAMSIAK